MEPELDKRDLASAVPGPDLGPAATSNEAVGFDALSNDENERFIGLCEAPALLWYTDSGAPGPFGVIV
jgi:hypothetical protein